MTEFEFVPAKRQAIPLLLGVAGGTGSGKTMSALLLARGIANGEPFAFIDTENGRGLHYADEFPEMQHGSITAKFRPEKYADAIEAADKRFDVIVVDSMSHEWAGDGGCLDWHDEIMGGNQAKNLAAWIEPKKAHKRMVTRLLQLQAHVILCFRAEPKVEVVDGPGGTKQYVAKKSLTGLDGWIPIAEKNLPYELTASFLLMAGRPGVPLPIKLPGKLAPFVPLDQPLTEDVGRQLASWAAGASSAGDIGPGGAHPDGNLPGASVPAAPADTRFASEPQRRKIFAEAKKHGVDTPTLKRMLVEFTGQESSAAIPADRVDVILAAIESVGVAS